MTILQFIYNWFYSILDANISADAYTDAQNSKCGASGGTVILDAINVSICRLIWYALLLKERDNDPARGLPCRRGIYTT